MNKDACNTLKILDGGAGRRILIDDKELQFVKSFNLKSLPKKMAVITVEMVVKYDGEAISEIDLSEKQLHQ